MLSLLGMLGFLSTVSWMAFSNIPVCVLGSTLTSTSTSTSPTLLDVVLEAGFS
jgi:hypothetical protein